MQMGDLLQSLIAGEANAEDQPAAVAKSPIAAKKSTPQKRSTLQKSAKQHGAANLEPSTSEVIDLSCT